MNSKRYQRLVNWIKLNEIGSLKLLTSSYSAAGREAREITSCQGRLASYSLGLRSRLGASAEICAQPVLQRRHHILLFKFHFFLLVSYCSIYWHNIIYIYIYNIIMCLSTCMYDSELLAPLHLVPQRNFAFPCKQEVSMARGTLSKSTAPFPLLNNLTGGGTGAFARAAMWLGTLQLGTLLRRVW